MAKLFAETTALLPLKITINSVQAATLRAQKTE
jgi:hypothetical protein